MNIWVALYCPCIYESSDGIISIHLSARGAYKAMMKHKIDEYNRQRELRLLCGERKGVKVCEHESWDIRRYEVRD